MIAVISSKSLGTQLFHIELALRSSFYAITYNIHNLMIVKIEILM